MCKADEPDAAIWGCAVDCVPADSPEASQCTVQPEQVANQSAASSQQCSVSELLSVEQYIDDLKQGDSMQVQVRTALGYPVP